MEKRTPSRNSMLVICVWDKLPQPHGVQGLGRAVTTATPRAQPATSPAHQNPHTGVKNHLTALKSFCCPWRMRRGLSGGAAVPSAGLCSRAQAPAPRPETRELNSKVPGRAFSIKGDPTAARFLRDRLQGKVPQSASVCPFSSLLPFKNPFRS